MFEVQQTEVFRNWRVNLKDQTARGLIAARLERFAYGNLGDVRSVGGGVSEARIHYGAGYRLYFQQRRGTIIVLLCAGCKGTQKQDIEVAKRLARMDHLS